MEKKHEHAGHRRRLMDKLDAGGLCEHEYLEALLFNVIPRRNTNDLAHRLLARFGSVLGVLEAPFEALRKVEGVGAETASYLYCVGKFCKEFTRCDEGKRTFPKMYSHDIFLPFIKRKYADLTYETLDLYLLDENGAIYRCKNFSTGHFGSVCIEPDDFARALLYEQPSGLIIVHNHPTGSCEPSDKDDTMTRTCRVFCLMHNVLLCDHYIYAPNGVFSYYQSGRLKTLGEESENLPIQAVYGGEK